MSGVECEWLLRKIRIKTFSPLPFETLFLSHSFSNFHQTITTKPGAFFNSLPRHIWNFFKSWEKKHACNVEGGTSYNPMLLVFAKSRTRLKAWLKSFDRRLMVVLLFLVLNVKMQSVTMTINGFRKSFDSFQSPLNVVKGETTKKR